MFLDRAPLATPVTPLPPGSGGSAGTTYTGYNSGNADFDRVLLKIANETPDQLAKTYNAIIAEPYAAFNTVLLKQNDFFADNVMDRAKSVGCAGAPRWAAPMRQRKASTESASLPAAIRRRSSGATAAGSTRPGSGVLSMAATA